MEFAISLAIGLVAGTINGIVGSTLMAGSSIARRFVLRMEPARFRLLMDGLMLLSGVALLWSAALL